ncbi:MAG: O-antigen ligase family protein [Kineosporiaceae bacterium]|nr:O-antigen ligase family protein [Kineosporiaceae bacterium]
MRQRLAAEITGAPVLQVLVWASVVLPALIQTIVAPKNRVFTTSVVPYSPVASAAGAVLTLAIVAWGALILFRRFDSLPTDGRTVLLVLLLPWVYQVTRDLYEPAPPRLGLVVYPVIVITMWVLRPRLEQLSTLGYLIGLTAALSLVLAVAWPTKGILVSAAGTVVTPDKQILPWGILIGPFTDGNPLGEFLSLGLPAVAFIRSRWLRPLIIVMTIFAVVWTATRSSIAGIGIAAALAIGLTVIPARLRRVTAIAALGAVAVTCMVLPLITTTSYAFSNRGYIWQASLRAWEQRPVVGLGSQWYAESAKYTTAIGETAFHGHNEFVQLLVLGGLINVALMALMLGVVIWRALSRLREGRTAPVALIMLILVSGCFEVSFSFVHRSYLMPVTAVPVALLVFARPGRTASGRTASASPSPTSAADPVGATT